MSQGVEYLGISILPNGLSRTVIGFDSNFLTMADGQKLGYPPITLGYRPGTLSDAQKLFDMIQNILDESQVREDEKVLRLINRL